MIYSIKGTLVHKEIGLAVIETNAGVAYEIKIGDSTFNQLPDEDMDAKLYTSLIVRENDMSLVGFLTVEDKRLYNTVITVSGVGPKHGLSILSTIPAERLRNAIMSGQVDTLSTVKGVGKKTAERIVLELKDKMKKIPAGETVGDIHPSSRMEMEALMAMRVLGYNDAVSKKAIAKVFEAPDATEQDIEEIIKRALAQVVKV